MLMLCPPARGIPAVGGANPAKIVRIIHNGSKEIGGAYDGFASANIEHGGIVAGFVAHQQPGEFTAGRQITGTGPQIT